ncbi:MAG: hypothetical protein JO093_11025 [Acidobacteria bacterium]|nr:hypothetical protein [Acidobacteriota bacterium]MBV9067953.1 hypothetical protein [Acidobacteriota bacterium]MBV9186149.1 hypothetical protein [Acidobacteriota bacterium]
MHYEEARGHRNRLLAEHYPDRVVEAHDLGVAEIEGSVGARKRRRRPSIGIHHRSDGSFGIAVRIQELSSEDNPMIAAIIERHGASNVDVRVTGIIQALAVKDVNRPLIIGCSCAHTDVNIGTLGCCVQKNGKTYLLSNNHVFGNSNIAQPGDAILQPSSTDHPLSDLVAATFVEFVKLDIAKANRVDAAIAEMAEGINCDTRTILGFPKPLADAAAGLPIGTVHKLGRSTDLTSGTISASGLIPVTVNIGGADYDFVDQIEITSPAAHPFSMKGDSGSVVFNDDGALVGLLFSGNEKTTTYANPIADVFAALGVTFK